MSVRILLDRPHAHFTNLDFITGKVLFTLPVDSTISSIVVKLEGESRSRLSGPKYPGGERSEKKKTELEVHKLLYQVLTLFPTPEIAENAPPSSHYTMVAGTYEYSFKFKFPFNNSCNENSMYKNLNMAGLRLEVGRDTNRHVRKGLPPSMASFPGEAEIKYYVKATVARPQFYKENYRSVADFIFVPIEPPRTGDPRKESYARRQQQFSKTAPLRVKGKFQKGYNQSPMPDPDAEPLRVSVDARLPSPPLLTCNEPVPLRILVQKLTESSEDVILQNIQIELIGYTHVRAHDLVRKESGSWILLSRSSLNMLLGRGSDPVGKEWTIDPTLWNKTPLPNTVAPSFETCNISRNYELELRVGLQRGTKNVVNPDLIVLPLRMAVTIYSGIAPPPALLKAVSVKRPNVPIQPAAEPSGPPPMPPRPAPAPTPAYDAESQEYEDAPPSYEDAMAEEIGPVDGPRREYTTPDTAMLGQSGSGADVNSTAGSGDKDTERLFPDSGPWSHSTDTFARFSDTPPDSPVGPQTSGESRESGDSGTQFPPEKEPLEPQQQQPPPPPPPPSSSPPPPPQPPVQQPRRTDFRTLNINMGVPNRKPVPKSAESPSSPTSRKV